MTIGPYRIKDFKDNRIDLSLVENCIGLFGCGGSIEFSSHLGHLTKLEQTTNCKNFIENKFGSN